MTQRKAFSQTEFITLMAALMSIVALAIDALLPALEIIGFDLGVTQSTDNQLLITMIFLGLGIGPVLFGPLSDSLGRKPVVFLGLLLFVAASLLCLYSENLSWMVAGRILQGIGLSAPRTISIAMVRDSFSGDYMARIMSFITVVFLLVPIIAPTMGQLILDNYNWQAIFYAQLGVTALVAWWFHRRQPETLDKAYRHPLSVKLFTGGIKELLRFPRTMGFTLISGFITGSFIVYLSASQQIFQQQYGLVDEFPYIFAALAISISISTFLNGSMVVRLGMRKLVTGALFGYFGVSLLYLLLYYSGANPPVLILLIFFGIQFFCVGFLFGNLRALAMEPIGHIAGIGAAFTGLISTLMAVPISTFIGSFVTASALPIFIGFTICSALSIGILLYLNTLPIKVERKTIS